MLREKALCATLNAANNYSLAIMSIIAVYDLFKDAFLATQALAGSYIQ